MEWVNPKNPRLAYQKKLKALGDCAYSSNYLNCLTPLVDDGSPYDIYERDGSVKKALPLMYRPPFGGTFPTYQGRPPYVSARNFYGPQGKDVLGAMPYLQRY